MSFRTLSDLLRYVGSINPLTIDLNTHLMVKNKDDDRLLDIADFKIVTDEKTGKKVILCETCYIEY